MDAVIDYFAGHLWLLPFAALGVLVIPSVVAVSAGMAYSTWMYDREDYDSSSTRRVDRLLGAVDVILGFGAVGTVLASFGASGYLTWQALSRGTTWGGEHGVLLGACLVGLLVVAFVVMGVSSSRSMREVEEMLILADECTPEEVAQFDDERTRRWVQNIQAHDG